MNEITGEIRFNPERLKSVLRANSIYDSELLSSCGYKKNSGFMDHPTEAQLKSMKEFFDKKYPLVNFAYIEGKSSSPNNLIDLKVVKYWMNAKNISISQLNNYIKTELGEDKAFYKILNGLYPRTEEQSNEIMNYLENLIDNNGNFNYSSAKKNDEKDVQKEIKHEKVEKKTKIVNSPSPLHETDPDNYRENKIDMKLFVQLCNSAGYNLRGLADMAYPGKKEYNTVYKFITNEVPPLSLPKKFIEGLQAALDCDIFYLEGTQRIGRGTKTNTHYFPKDDKKNYKFTSNFLNTTDLAMFKVMANNAGISYKLFTRARSGENIYFMDTTIRRMFTKDLLQVMKIKNLNDIVISADGEPITGAVTGGKKGTPIVLPENRAKKVYKKKEEKAELGTWGAVTKSDNLDLKIENKKDLELSEEAVATMKEYINGRKAEDKVEETKVTKKDKGREIPQYTDATIDKIVKEVNEREAEIQERVHEELEGIAEYADKPYVDKKKIKYKPEPVEATAEEKIDAIADIKEKEKIFFAEQPKPEDEKSLTALENRKARPMPNRNTRIITPTVSPRDFSSNYRSYNLNNDKDNGPVIMKNIEQLHNPKPQFTCECGYSTSVVRVKNDQYKCPLCGTGIIHPFSAKFEREEKVMENKSNNDITLKDVVAFINTCDCTPEQLESLSKLCLAVAEKNKIFNDLQF